MVSRSAHVALLYSLLTCASAVENLFARQAVSSFDASQTATCLSLAQGCFPTVASCTPAFCSACASVGGPDFVSCCDGSTAASCIATLLATAATSASGSAANTITSNGASPSGSKDPNLAACSAAFNLISSCASNTLGFTSLDDGGQASCLCYTASSGASGTTTVFAPAAFDKLQSGCVAWASTSDTTDLSVFQAAAGLCTRVGNVRGSSGAGTTTGTAAAATSTGLGSGGAISTRTASMTSASSAGSATQSIASASSSAAAAGMGRVHDDNGKAAWSLGYFLLAFGWLV